jgi:hypothetical protein
MTVTIDGSASVTINSGAVLGINSATAVPSTSGTSIDFTDMPSWVKRITVMFSGVSGSGTSIPQIQVGSGLIVTSGYTSGAFSPNTLNTVGATSGFILAGGSVLAAQTRNGAITLHNISGNTWIGSGVLGIGVNGAWQGADVSGGSILLSGTLDRVRITTVNGTDTFDAGTINILYE